MQRVMMGAATRVVTQIPRAMAATTKPITPPRATATAATASVRPAHHAAATIEKTFLVKKPPMPCVHPIKKNQDGDWVSYMTIHPVKHTELNAFGIIKIEMPAGGKHPATSCDRKWSFIIQFNEKDDESKSTEPHAPSHPTTVDDDIKYISKYSSEEEIKSKADIKRGIYRHKKGGWYRVIERDVKCFVFNPKTHNYFPAGNGVFYEHLWPHEHNYFVRPQAMFDEEGRFELVKAEVPAATPMSNADFCTALYASD